jgi:hypothetical protein
VADHATALNRALGSWWSAAAAAVMATRPARAARSWSSPQTGRVLRSSRASTRGHIVWAPIRAQRGCLGWCSAAPRRDCDQPDGAIPRDQGLPESGGTIRRCGCAVCDDGRITSLLVGCHLNSLAAGDGSGLGVVGQLRDRSGRWGTTARLHMPCGEAAHGLSPYDHHDHAPLPQFLMSGQPAALHRPELLLMASDAQVHFRCNVTFAEGANCTGGVDKA